MAIRSYDKPLFQPWNEDDFSGDLLVSAMTPVQKWMYRTLLQRAFFHSTRPDLPNDPELLWRLAGCESRKQWDENSAPVLEMFKLEQLGLPGESLLYQKRLRRDFDRLMDSREAYSDRGKKGAQTRWGTTEPADAPKVTQKELNALKLIPQYCRTLLGVRPEREDYYKAGIKELAEDYGGTQVVNAFEVWAKTYNGDTRFPIKEFVRVADQYLTNRVRQDNPELEKLCLDLYGIGGFAFTGKYKVALNALLEQFSAEEIVKGYSEFTANKDDFGMKWAPKDFCEGGATTVLAAISKRAEDKIKQDRYMEREVARMRDEASKDDSETEIVEERL